MCKADLLLVPGAESQNAYRYTTPPPRRQIRVHNDVLNPLNAELNPICHLMALLGAHHILHVGRIRVKHYEKLYFSYIYFLFSPNFTLIMKQWKFPRRYEEHSLLGREARTVWSIVVNCYWSTQSCLYACHEGV